MRHSKVQPRYGDVGDEHLSDPVAALRSDLHDLAELIGALKAQTDATQALLNRLQERLERRLCALDDLGGERLSAIPASVSRPSAHDWSSPAHLRLLCLGTFEVQFSAGRVPTRRSGKYNTILRYLAIHPRQPVVRDVLLEVLWPNADPDIANNRLRVAMHHLRQAFAVPESQPACVDYVLFRDGCYLFNPAIDVWTDIEAFEQNWRAGMQMEQAGRWEEAAAAYGTAEALYRGDLFAEDPYEEWTLVRREELRDIYLSLLDKLSHYALKSGNIDGAIEGWKKILGKDPLREDAYCHLMIHLAGRGQRALALHWYDVCTQTLQHQLNVEPEARTSAIAQRIRSGADVGGIGATLTGS
ncbi:MAG: BTAD domain-containing putative transcriptional regulator [Anaerolineae bacterium]